MKPRTCVLLQPCYIPWRGYFDQIRRADVFVHYDDVQYDKNGWRNRNRLKGPNGSFWVTIPVSLPHGNRATHLAEARIDSSQRWQAKHWRSIKSCYQRASHFADVAAWLQPWYHRTPDRLIDFTIPLVEECARRLGLSDTEFLRSSSLAVEGERSERIAAICRAVGATHYLSGPSARAYIDEDLLGRAGITVEYMVYDYPPYPQLHGGFDRQVSILDTLFVLGTENPAAFWGNGG